MEREREKNVVPSKRRSPPYPYPSLRLWLTLGQVRQWRLLYHVRELWIASYVDATLRLLDPSVDIDAIPNKRPRRRIKLFRQGELGRMILKVLREANAPLSTAAIVSAVLATGWP